MKTAIKWSLITSGIVTLLGPAIGLLGTVIGMMGTFKNLGASGIGTPEKLSSDISVTLISTVAGFTIGIIGLVSFIVCLIIWLCTRSSLRQPPIQNAAEQGAAANP